MYRLARGISPFVYFDFFKAELSNDVDLPKPSSLGSSRSLKMVIQEKFLFRVLIEKRLCDKPKKSSDSAYTPSLPNTDKSLRAGGLWQIGVVRELSFKK